MEIFSFTRYSMIMSDLWDQISEIADLNKVTSSLSLTPSRSPWKVGPGGYRIPIFVTPTTTSPNNNNHHNYDHHPTKIWLWVWWNVVESWPLRVLQNSVEPLDSLIFFSLSSKLTRWDLGRSGDCRGIPNLSEECLPGKRLRWSAFFLQTVDSGHVQHHWHWRSVEIFLIVLALNSFNFK